MHRGLGFDARQDVGDQLDLAGEREAGEAHLNVDDGEVDDKGGGGGVLVLEQQRLDGQLDVRVVLDPLVDVHQQLHHLGQSRGARVSFKGTL